MPDCMNWSHGYGAEDAECTPEQIGPSARAYACIRVPEEQKTGQQARVAGIKEQHSPPSLAHSPPSLAHSPPSLAHSPPSLARGRLCLNPSPGVELPPQLGLDQRGRCPPLLPRGLRR
jgi:hypothetical protein